MEWLKKCYSRLLSDNHTTDLKADFMSRFAPAEYLRMVRLCRVDSSMLACPNIVGKTHDGRYHYYCPNNQEF